jgi:hypothetical protein
MMTRPLARLIGEQLLRPAAVKGFNTVSANLGPWETVSDQFSTILSDEWDGVALGLSRSLGQHLCDRLQRDLTSLLGANLRQHMGRSAYLDVSHALYVAEQSVVRLHIQRLLHRDFSGRLAPIAAQLWRRTGATEASKSTSLAVLPSALRIQIQIATLEQLGLMLNRNIRARMLDQLVTWSRVNVQ